MLMLLLFFKDCNCLASQALLLSILLKREGQNFITKEGKSFFHVSLLNISGSSCLFSFNEHE